MTSPASGTVLGLAAVATSPALWQGLVTGELPLDLALTRYLLTVVAVWLGLSLLSYVVGAPSTSHRTPDQAAPAPDDVQADGPSERPAAA